MRRFSFNFNENRIRTNNLLVMNPMSSGFSFELNITVETYFFARQNDPNYYDFGCD